MFLIKTKKRTDIRSHEITPEGVYASRRQFMMAGIAAATTAMLGCAPEESAADDDDLKVSVDSLSYSPVRRETGNAFYTEEALTPYRDAISYNNFYEFGTGKTDPAEYAHKLTTKPWTIECTGELENDVTLDIADLIKRFPLEERIYRLRCVEAWSMVIPWVGFPLASLIKYLQPTSNAKYVSFKTAVKKSEMRGVRSFYSTIDWPYREALRMDEALHPLTFLAVGMYGNELYPQNGAPIRLVVPWKYGFKSIKSIVKIQFNRLQPDTSWNMIAPDEYGFYANVNPEVSHPRWSQAKERRLPGSLFNVNRIDTLPFNGYGDEVASLYTGMDLRKYY